MEKTKNSYKKWSKYCSCKQFVKHIAKISKKCQKKNKNQSSGNIGAFGSTFDISRIKLKTLFVSSTDGVGAKLDLANKFKKFHTIGIDLVAMCVNDLIVQTKPLFFLDYIAVGKLNLKKIKLILKVQLKNYDI